LFKLILYNFRFGETVPLTKKVENLFNEVLNDLNINEKQTKLYKPFAIIGYQLFRAGFNSQQYGSIIGIPVNYSFEDKFIIDIEDIRIGYNQERLNIYDPAANSLIDSLFLSDKAKKYGIAREILMCNTNLLVYRCIETPIMITATAMLAEFIRLKLAKTIVRSFTLKSILFTIIGLLGYSLWFQFRDILNIYYEKSVDNQLANLSLDYVEGGKEFYEKHLQRNVALRSLLGIQGAKEYNQDGDEIITIRRKRTPLTERRQFFMDYALSQNEQYNYYNII
jgi:hypothetical protein